LEAEGFRPPPGAVCTTGFQPARNAFSAAAISAPSSPRGSNTKKMFNFFVPHRLGRRAFHELEFLILNQKDSPNFLDFELPAGALVPLSSSASRAGAIT
jgi:hypothetical protein